MPLARRTTVVWGVLLGAMTITSITLSVLQPTPVPVDGPMGLRVVYREPTPEEKVLFDTRARLLPQRWQRLAICYSGEAEGSAALLAARHHQRGGDGLAYHFVINNGRGAPDGQIEIGIRWSEQQSADLQNLPTSAATDEGTIWICMVGRGDQPPTEAQQQQLRWLTGRLTRKLGLTTDLVWIGSDADAQWSAAAGVAGQRG